jgi:hypothetical protein
VTVQCQELTCCSVKSARALMSSRVRQPEAYQRRQVASAAPHTFRNCTAQPIWVVCYSTASLFKEILASQLTHAQVHCQSMLTKAARPTSGCDAVSAAKGSLLCGHNVQSQKHAPDLLQHSCAMLSPFELNLCRLDIMVMLTS